MKKILSFALLVPVLFFAFERLSKIKQSLNSPDPREIRTGPNSSSSNPANRLNLAMTPGRRGF